MIAETHFLVGKTDHHIHDNGESECLHCEVWSTVANDLTTLDDILEKIGDGKLVEVTIKVIV